MYQDEVVRVVRAQAFHNKLTYMHASEEIVNDNEGILGQTMSKFMSGGGGGLGHGKKKTPKREVNASLEEPTAWKCRLFNNFVAPDCKYIKCGDVIWLHHSEADTTLAAHRRDRCTDKYNFSSLNISAWLQRQNLDVIAQKSAQESSYDEFAGNTFGMWLIEDENCRQGGKSLGEISTLFFSFNKFYSSPKTL